MRTDCMNCNSRITMATDSSVNAMLRTWMGEAGTVVSPDPSTPAVWSCLLNPRPISLDASDYPDRRADF